MRIRLMTLDPDDRRKMIEPVDRRKLIQHVEYEVVILRGAGIYLLVDGGDCRFVL